MCSGSEAGSYLRHIDFVYHSTLGLQVTKKKVTVWQLARSRKICERSPSFHSRVEGWMYLRDKTVTVGFWYKIRQSRPDSGVR